MGGPLSAETNSTEMEEDAPATPIRAPEQVSELGALVLGDPRAPPAVLYTVSGHLTSVTNTLLNTAETN